MNRVLRTAAAALALFAISSACTSKESVSDPVFDQIVGGDMMDEEVANDLRSRLNPDDPLLFIALQALTFRYAAEGHLVDARRMQEEILERLRRLSATSNVDFRVACAARNLAWMLLMQGDPSEALRFAETSVHLCEKLPSAFGGHPEFGVALWLRGMIVERLGRDDDAEESLRRACEVFSANERQFPYGDERFVECLIALGGLLATRGRYDEARAELTRAEREISKSVADSRPPTSATRILSATTSLALGLVFLRSGRLEEAIAKLSEARLGFQSVDVRPSPLGAVIPSIGTRTADLAFADQALGWACYLAGDPDRAVDHLREAMRAETVQGTMVLSRAGEAEAGNYIDSAMQTWRLIYAPWTAAGFATGDLHELMASRKATLYRFLRARKALPANGTELLALQNHLLDINNRLSGAILVTGELRSRAGYEKRIADLQAEKSAIERGLARNEPFFAELLDPESPGRKLCEALPAQCAFVDFYAVWTRQARPEGEAPELPEGGKRYVAFIVLDGKTSLVDLGSLQELDEAIGSWRRALTSGQPHEARERAADMWNALWRPLETRFDGAVRRVILCPDGALAMVPWGALRGVDGLVAEKYCLSVVAHPSEVTASGGIDAPSGTGDGRFLCVGDVSYSSAPDQLCGPRPAVSGVQQQRPEAQWEQLRRSRLEVDEVGELARAVGKQIEEPLVMERASTTRVADRLPRARWIHMSTHGFFADPEHRKNVSMVDWAFTREPESPGWLRVSAVERSPLAVVGLVMAGANRGRAMDEAGVPIDDGGILSGAAIASLDLSGASLVVLSACDTARGMHSYGEGVFGLARAFHLAGAHQVVATLWQVNEEKTLVLLRLFYANYLQRRMPAAQALQDAQMQLHRRLLADDELSNDPAYYWSGLYVSGP